MREAVNQLWPEIQWIGDTKLREQVTQTWIKALQRSPLKPNDLNYIPFTLLVPHCPVTFMQHKRCVVHMARKCAEAMQEFMGSALPVNLDTVIAGAVLADARQRLHLLQPDRNHAPEVQPRSLHASLPRLYWQPAELHPQAQRWQP